MNYCVIFISAESPLQIPSESAEKSDHPKPAFPREFAERGKKKKKDKGPSLMTKPFVCKNFSQMTQEFPVNVFGADPCVIQTGVCLCVTQSFSFIGISEILFEVPPFVQKMD